MRKIFLIYSLAAALCMTGCAEKPGDIIPPDDPIDKPDDDDEKPKTYSSFEFVMQNVFQYDRKHPGGIDIGSKFGFFETMGMTVHYYGKDIYALTYSNGDVPFGMGFPAGEKIEVVADGPKLIPQRVLLKDSDTVVGFLRNDVFTIQFKLDSDKLGYEYVFKRGQQVAEETE